MKGYRAVTLTYLEVKNETAKELYAHPRRC